MRIAAIATVFALAAASSAFVAPTAALAAPDAGVRAATCPASTGAQPLAGTPTNTVYLPNVTKTLGGPNGWVTPFIVQNIDASSSTNLELSFYRFSDGCLITRRIVNALAPFRSYADVPNNDADLPDSTQFSVVVRSFGATAVAVVNQVQGTGASFQGAAYTGSSSGATKMYLPNVTRRFYGYDVPFIVQDLGAVTANASAAFTSLASQSCTTAHTYTKALSVQPGQSSVIDPNFEATYNGTAGSGLMDGCQYAVIVTSDQPVAVVANAHNEAGAPVAYSHNALATGGATLYAPYAAKNADGVGRYSPVVVQNLGTTSVSPTLTFTPYPSTGGGGTGYPHSLGSDNPCPAFPGANCYTFVVTSGGAPLQGVCLAITSGANPGCPDPHYDTDATGTVKVGTLAAPGDFWFLYPGKPTVGPIHVTSSGTTAVTMASGASASPQSFAIGPIAAGASAVFDPRFTQGTTTACSGASSTCLGDGVFSLTATAAGGSIAMVVLPVSDVTSDAYTATPAPGSRAFMPNVTRTLGGASGYTTPIYLQSAGAATGATLRWYRFSDGQLVTTQSVAIPAGGGASVDPRNVAALSDDTQYAVVADGVGGTIYAIVFEQAFTGGDAAFIYQGFVTP